MLTKLGRQLGEGPKKVYAQNAVYVNFTEAVGFPGSMGPSHSYYFASITEKSNNIKNYYSDILQGNEIRLNDDTLFAFIPNEKYYAIIF